MKLRFLSLFCLACLLLSCVGCGGQTYTQTFYDRCDTDVRITLYTDMAGAAVEECFAGCLQLLDEGETLFSRVDQAAELARLNESEEAVVALSPALAALLSRALSLAAETDGLFDPTAGILSDLYDIGGTSPLPQEDDVAAVLPLVGYQALSLDGTVLTRPVGAVLDLGAIAKGHLAEEMVDLLMDAGVAGGVLSLGGNIAVFGEKPDGSPFRVAIRDPHVVGQTVGVVTLTETAYISTSGAYERYRVDEDGVVYHHIFDTRSGRPADSDLASVTVIAPDGARADALSTALFVAGYEQALAMWEAAERDFDMVLVKQDGSIFTTPRLAFTPT